MKGVILAAGFGGRLRPLTLGTPKVLLKMGRNPLIHYALEALRDSGISEIAVVVGYQAQKALSALREMYPWLSFVYNEHYKGGNAISVLAARSFVMEEPFVVCMGDHLISPKIVSRLLSDSRDGCILCIDPEAWHPSQLDDATRVMIGPSGNVATIGKELKVWNAVDTGVFKMTRDVFPVIEHLLATHGVEVSITDVVRFMGGSGRPFLTCDVSGMFWADVDTPEDYRTVEILLRQEYGERV